MKSRLSPKSSLHAHAFLTHFPTFSDGRFAAVKVSASRYGDTAKDEISLLLKARKRAFQSAYSRGTVRGGMQWQEHPGAKHVISLLDYFSMPGRFKGDTHICMVFEPLGETLLNFLDKHRTIRYDEQGLGGIPIKTVKVIAKQVLMGLQYLHDECRLVHTDIKPENIRALPLNSCDLHGIMDMFCQYSPFRIRRNTFVRSLRRRQLFPASASRFPANGIRGATCCRERHAMSTCTPHNLSRVPHCRGRACVDIMASRKSRTIPLSQIGLGLGSHGPHPRGMGRTSHPWSTYKYPTLEMPLLSTVTSPKIFKLDSIDPLKP